MSEPKSILPDAEKRCKERFPGFLYLPGGNLDLKDEVDWLERYGKDCLRAFCEEVERRAEELLARRSTSSHERARTVSLRELRRELGI